MSSDSVSGNGNTGMILAEIGRLRTEVLAWRAEHSSRILELERAPKHSHDPLPERLSDRLRAVENVVLRQTVLASLVGALATGVTLGLSWLMGWVKIGGGR